MLRSKLVADRSWRTEREKTTQLERELAFYQAQSATAMVCASFLLCHWGPLRTADHVTRDQGISIVETRIWPGL